MPTIARICGLSFNIFNEMGAPHHLKHVLVTYGDDSAIFDIKTGQLLAGTLKTNQMRMVRKILRNELNKKELLRCWDALNVGNVQESRVKMQITL